MEKKREKSGAEAEFPPEEPSLPLMGVVTSFKNFIIPMSFALHGKSFQLFQLFFGIFEVVTSFKNFIIPMSFALHRKSFKLFDFFLTSYCNFWTKIVHT